MLKIGWIDYANCTPLLLQIEKPLIEAGIELVHGVPAELNSSLSKGEIDLCISSSIEFARHSDEYAILPGHCIGSDGPVMSVLLFSPRKVSELAGEKILVTSESATSVVLLKILLSRHWGLDNCILEPSSLCWKDTLSSGHAALLIGDSALKAAIEGDFAFCYDLGEEWKAMTALPFVYALWQVNLASAAGKKNDISILLGLLDRAKDMNPARLDELSSAASERSWMGQEYLRRYWQHISYDFDGSHRRGLELFYAIAAEMSLVPQMAALNFYQV